MGSWLMPIVMLCGLHRADASECVAKITECYLGEVKVMATASKKDTQTFVVPDGDRIIYGCWKKWAHK